MTLPQKLAIRLPNWVGDLVMATPVLEAAFAQIPDLTLLCRPHLIPLLEGAPYAPRLRAARSSEEVEAYAEFQPEAALLLTNSLGAAWRAYRAGVPRRVGAGLSGRGLLLTDSFRPPQRAGRRLPIPTAHLLRDVAGLIGLHVPDLHPRLYSSPERELAQAPLLRELGVEPERGWLACSPGAAYGAAKLWPPERFAAAIDGLFERTGLPTVLCGAPAEFDLAEEVRAKARPGAALSLPPDARSLPGLVSLIAGAKFLLVGDSGPRWIAAAFDVPCVSLMGPNFPELTATSLEHCEVLRVEGLDCSPCLERVCPLGHHRCMTELSVERVLAAADRLLAAASVS